MADQQRGMLMGASVLLVGAAGAVLVPVFPQAPLLCLVNGLVTAALGATAVLLAAEPGQRLNARLFLAAAAAWTAGYVGVIASGPWPLVEWLIGPLVFPLLATAILRYPRARLDRRPARVFVGALAGAVTVLQVARALVVEPAWIGYPGALWPTVVSSRDAASWLGAAFGIVAAGFAVGFLVLVADHLRRTSAIDRRLLAPVVVAAAGSTVVAGAEVAGRIAPLAPAAANLVLGVEAAAMLSIPAAFLMSAVRRRLAGAAVSDLVVTLARPATPDAIRRALAASLGDPGLTVLYRGAPGPGPDFIDHGGGLVDAPATSGRTLREVTAADGSPLATIMLDASLAAHPHLVDAAVAAARLALENARLQVLLQARLLEVHESRARIVAAGDAERRRLERDLHDGVQQRILALKTSLGAARITAGGTRESAVLDGARGELQLILDDIRALARGIHPAILTEAGLGPALAAVADRLPVAATLRISCGRLAPVVEATAYFVCCEALTNIVKHAGAQRATIEIAERDGLVDIRVSDDGRGEAQPKAGGGLVGIRDRVTTVGGQLDVRSCASGTTVAAVLPCA